MSLCFDYLETADNRLALYGFLARIYRSEVDLALLDALQMIDFFTDGEIGEYAEGAACLQKCLKSPSFTMRQDLAVDFARCFLAAGITHGGAAFPYESVYTSEDGLVMQDARDEVMLWYRKKGLRIVDTIEPEDHIAFELEFMGQLICEGQQAAHAGDETKLQMSMNEQREFLTTHLLNWIPQFCKDVKRYAATEFYRAIASMTSGFLTMDAAMIEREVARCQESISFSF